MSTDLNKTMLKSHNLPSDASLPNVTTTTTTATVNTNSPQKQSHTKTMASSFHNNSGDVTTSTNSTQQQFAKSKRAKAEPNISTSATKVSSLKLKEDNNSYQSTNSVTTETITNNHSLTATVTSIPTHHHTCDSTCSGYTSTSSSEMLSLPQQDANRDTITSSMAEISTPQRHATKLFHASQQPTIQLPQVSNSFEEEQMWVVSDLPDSPTQVNQNRFDSNQEVYSQSNSSHHSTQNTTKSVHFSSSPHSSPVSPPTIVQSNEMVDSNSSNSHGGTSSLPTTGMPQNVARRPTNSNHQSPPSVPLMSLNSHDTPIPPRTRTRPRSKSKRKLHRMNLSIRVPPSEQTEEFRQGSLVITKDGITQFEASPLENKTWNGIMASASSSVRITTPSSLSTTSGSASESDLIPTSALSSVSTSSNTPVSADNSTADCTPASSTVSRPPPPALSVTSENAASMIHSVGKSSGVSSSDLSSVTGSSVSNNKNSSTTDNSQEQNKSPPSKVSLFDRYGLQCDNSIQLKDLKYMRELGRGASSVVSLMQHRPTGKLYAMKTLILDSERISPSMIYDEIEALLLARDSSYIINLVQAFYDKKQIHLLLEYIDGSSLEQLLMRRKQLPEYVLSLITSQILVALQFLHPKIMHMDIKPANILIASTGRVYIADFGTMVKQKRLQDPDSMQRYSELGTVLFWPPERAQNLPFDYRSDIWNLGITLFVLRVGKLPFSYTNATTHFQIRDMIEKLDIKEIIKKNSHLISPEFADFLEKCLQKDPAKRGTAEELQSHPFITNYKSVWTQNSGEDRVSNYLSIDEFHINASEKTSKSSTSHSSQPRDDHRENVTRTDEIIRRALKSRESSPTEPTADLFSPSSSTPPPSNTDIYFEMYDDSSKQETLEYEPTSFNSRTKKKFYHRKSYHPVNSSSQSTPSSEKSWKNNSQKRTKSSYHSGTSRRMPSMDFDFEDIFDPGQLAEDGSVSASTAGSHTSSHVLSPRAEDSHEPRSTRSTPIGTPIRSRSRSTASSATPPSASSYDSGRFRGRHSFEIPPHHRPSTHFGKKQMHSPQLERAQAYVKKHLPNGDLYARKKYNKFQKMLRSLSKEEQDKMSAFMKKYEKELELRSPTSWSQEKELLHSPTFGRTRFRSQSLSSKVAF